MDIISARPLVSVVLATYNGERFLREQIDSLLSQTYPNIEIVAVDDCSSDSSIEILNEYFRNHKNFTVHRNETNLGYVKTFEKGIRLSQGSVVSLCDQDDVWEQEKISKTMNALLENESVAAYCDSLLIDCDGHSLNLKISDVKNLCAYKNSIPFFIGNCVSGHACLFTREFANEIMPFPNDVIHDWWIAFNATLREKLSYVKEPLVRYRQHAANVLASHVKPQKKIHSRHERMEREREEARKRIDTFYKNCPDNKTREKEILQKISESYKSFSFSRNLMRVSTFLKNRDELLAIKRKSASGRWFWCLKMFFRIL